MQVNAIISMEIFDISNWFEYYTNTNVLECVRELEEQFRVNPEPKLLKDCAEKLRSTMKQFQCDIDWRLYERVNVHIQNIIDVC